MSQCTIFILRQKGYGLQINIYFKLLICRKYSFFSFFSFFVFSCWIIINFKSFPAAIYLLKVSIRNTRTRCEICSKLTIKIPGIFIVNFEDISHLVLVFLLLTLNMILPAGLKWKLQECPSNCREWKRFTEILGSFFFFCLLVFLGKNYYFLPSATLASSYQGVRKGVRKICVPTK